MRDAEFTNFIVARERHRWVKEGLHSWKSMKSVPNPIIEKYRFCNIRRNDDRVTRWVHKYYMNRWRQHEHVWFALLVARLFNNEETLATIAEHVIPFNPAGMKRTLHARADMGKKNFNAAYIVSTNGLAMNKVDYVVDKLLCPAWDRRKEITAALDKATTLAEAHVIMMGLKGCASFMAAQVLADLKYLKPKKWADFDTFVASGPGSKRGLNRVMQAGRVNDGWKEDLFLATLLELREKTNKRLARIPGIGPLTAQDIQNCLCEFDKYERARTGEGEPKQLYKPLDLPWEN